MSILPSPVGRAVAIGRLLGLVSLALFAGVRAASAEPSQESKKNPDAGKPVTMSAEEFGRLPAADQRTLLVRAFQRRLEHRKNLHYESDEVIRSYTNREGKPGEPLEGSTHWRFRHWLLGDSFRADLDRYRSLTDTQPSSLDSRAVNAEERLGRETSIEKDGKRPPQGWVTYPFDPSEHMSFSRYFRWIADKDFSNIPEWRRWDSLFPFLLDRKDRFIIEAPFEGDKVRLTVPWKPRASAPGGKRVVLLDPRKGFLPIRCESRCEGPPTEERRTWREETFVVEESRLVGDVWMPIKLRETFADSSWPDRIDVHETTALHVEFGAVKPADIQVPFPEGMRIIDAVEGVEYVADALGNPAGPAKIARGWKNKPPEGWQKRQPASIPSMASRLSAADLEMIRSDERQKAERRKSLAAALAVLRSGPGTPTDERIEAGLGMLWMYRIGENEALWAAAIRELISIGKPAVPRLLEELDRTEREETLRALGFVLRGIGDHRAVPAMIRAIPRLLQPSRSDFGLLIEDDPDLARFMREHDNDNREWIYFSYDRPIQEIMSALEKMTGETHGWKDLNFVGLDGSPEQQRIQRTLFLRLAQRWTDWWSKSWRNHVENEADAQLERTGQALERYAESVAAMPRQPRIDFPCGPNVVLGGGAQNSSIRAFDESPSGGFVDLDTGRWPVPPEDLVQRCSDHKPSEELLAWAEREGVDVIYVKIAGPDGRSYSAIQPVGMKVWGIADDRFDRLPEELRRTKRLELPALWEGPLVQTEEQAGAHGAKPTASFLFITREGNCGALRIQGFTTPAARGSGRGGSAPPACSTGDGVLYRFIYERDEKEEQRGKTEQD